MIRITPIYIYIYIYTFSQYRQDPSEENLILVDTRYCLFGEMTRFNSSRNGRQRTSPPQLEEEPYPHAEAKNRPTSWWPLFWALCVVLFSGAVAGRTKFISVAKTKSLKSFVDRTIGGWVGPAPALFNQIVYDNTTVEYCVGDILSSRPGAVHVCGLVEGADSHEKAFRGFVYGASERAKLMFCFIPKNGCTKTRSLFMRLGGYPKEYDWHNNRGGKNQTNKIHGPWANGAMVQKRLSEGKRLLFDELPRETQLDALSANNSAWVRAVILRDPVDRFLSAFLMFAVYQPDMHLPPEFKTLLGSGTVRLYPTVASLKEFLRLRLWLADAHFSLQKEWCGFQVLPRTFYNRFFVYNRDVNLDNATAALFDHRVDNEIYNGWPNGSLWASDTSHSTRGSSSYDRLVAELCADRDALDLVLEYTRPDYEFFGFPPPKICERSTGRERGSKWEDRADL